MRSLIIFLCLLIFLPNLYAQDTLWVISTGKSNVIKHQVEFGETIYILSQKFHVPLAVLSATNNVNYKEGIRKGSIFEIPVGKFNYYRINSVVKSKPIFYKVKSGEGLRHISRLFNVSQGAIQIWNKLKNPVVSEHQVLQVGWVYYDKTQVPFPVEKEKVIAIEKKLPSKNRSSTDTVFLGEDTVGNKVITPFEQLFKIQNESQSITQESGAAVFYPLKMQVDEGQYFVFHDNLERGTIISITNPANGVVIYAKVIGPLPNINEYHNAIIGLSNNAAIPLEAKGNRMFCNIRY